VLAVVAAADIPVLAELVVVAVALGGRIISLLLQELPIQLLLVAVAELTPVQEEQVTLLTQVL
jgi:hypothetical protein